MVRVLDDNFPSLTSCCLSVRKLIDALTYGGWDGFSLFWRVSGMMVLKAELKSTNRIPHKSLVRPDAAGWSAVPCWLHHPQTYLLCRQTAWGPVRVQWRTSDKPKPVFQIISWPQMLEPLVCSYEVQSFWVSLGRGWWWGVWSMMGLRLAPVICGRWSCVRTLLEWEVMK